MLHFPSPGLLSVYRANFDAWADKIPTPPSPRYWILPSNMVAVTSHETLHQPTSIRPSIFNFGAFSHGKTGTHALQGRGGGWAKACDVILTKRQPNVDQNLPSKGTRSRLSSTLLIMYINISRFKLSINITTHFKIVIMGFGAEA